MPKAKYREGRGKVGTSRVYKYKLGNRKSSTSAHTLSNEELLNKYNNPSTKKDKNKIAKVLRLRGVVLGESAPVLDVEDLIENED